MYVPYPSSPIPTKKHHYSGFCGNHFLTFIYGFITQMYVFNCYSLNLPFFLNTYRFPYHLLLFLCNLLSILDHLSYTVSHRVGFMEFIPIVQLNMFLCLACFLYVGSWTYTDLPDSGLIFWVLSLGSGVCAAHA